MYEPQKAAEATQLQATNATTKNDLEAGKGQINTDYTSAINNLKQSILDQTGKINQLYSQRLGGNFSGLQGNDLGAMYARGNQQQATIESTRANKLAAITTGETNADIKYQADLSALTPKYQSLEADYANKAYTAAATAYQKQQNSDRTYNLAVAKLGISASNRSNAAALKSQAGYKVTGKVGSGGTNSSTGASTKGTADKSNGYNFQGPNGEPINMAEFINGAGKNVNDVLDLLQNGSSYDQQVYRQVKAAGLSNNDPQAIMNLIAQSDRYNAYGFR